MTVAILVAISLPVLVRAQSGADTAPVILLHPRVATVLQLREEIEHARVLDRDEIRIAILGDKLYVRPRPGTPAGVEASLEVETRTARWTFRLLVVARARDASRVIRVPPVEAQAPEAPPPEPPPGVPLELVASPLVVAPEATPEAPPGVPAEPVVPPEVPAEPVPPPLALAPEAIEAAANAATHAPGPAPAEEPAEPITAPAPTEIRAPRPEISVHAIGSLGFTSLDVAGYAPFVARQSHLGFGVRLRVARPDAWWAVEANVSGDRFGGPVTFVEPGQRLPPFAMKGSLLRAEVSLRARFGTKWSPSIYAGGGVQAHLRRTEGMRAGPAYSETMPRGAVLVLGIGLQRRAGNLLLGLDFQVREGGPDGYHSAALLWTVGCDLDPD